MGELTSRERLQPSLLDRLSDDDREQVVEPRDKRVLSMRDLRKAVLRDLGWLLFSRSHFFGVPVFTVSPAKALNS